MPFEIYQIGLPLSMKFYDPVLILIKNHFNEEKKLIYNVEKKFKINSLLMESNTY